MKTVLMVHPHDLRFDPWTIRILQLARGLTRQGWRVFLCHLPRKEKPDHPPLRQLREDDPPVYDLFPRQFHVFRNGRVLYRLASECDLVHLQKSFAATALPLLWICRMLQIPLHYDWDDDETAIAQKVEKRFFSRLQLAVYENNLPHFATTITYSSQAIRDRALAFGFPSERMWHLPVGADCTRFLPSPVNREIYSQFGLDPNKQTVLYIGQMEGAAYANRLLEAAPLVLKKMPNCQFLLIGGGEQLKDVRDQAQQSEAREALFIPGYIEAERIPAVVNAADLCVACFDESKATRAKSPLKIAEYMAAGKPIVATDVGEAPWMIKGGGITVKAGSVESLAEGILAYLEDPNRKKQDGERARKRALNHFTWEHGVETLLNAYQECLKESKRKRILDIDEPKR